jgi:hypothetical protein
MAQLPSTAEAPGRSSGITLAMRTLVVAQSESPRERAPHRISQAKTSDRARPVYTRYRSAEGLHMRWTAVLFASVAGAFAIGGCGSSSPPIASPTSKSEAGVRGAEKQLLTNLNVANYSAVWREITPDALGNLEVTKGPENPPGVVADPNPGMMADPATLRDELPSGAPDRIVAHVVVRIDGNWAYVFFPEKNRRTVQDPKQPVTRFVYSSGRWLFNDSLS